MSETDAAGTDPSGSDASSVPERAGTALERIRTDSRHHAVAVVVAVALGLALSWLHWFGLVVGGALVALTASTPWRGVAGAIGFGVVVLVAFALSLGGSAGTVFGMTPVIYLVVASAIGLPVLGSLVRGIV
ncbi:hypothetical protein [Haloterrigena alkaliphila]|uniref:Uncharacterized protein n=1 Tax=Haloterrigena alkaliphila TaxID=2816475 RepID=A0A8A2VD18_9EURY|nr:hypothetical protein [Haloterrigena alkaliphila]QSW98610.1 hypothetical protein J0X25_14600 [Haloterrigena alkaliphila]